MKLRRQDSPHSICLFVFASHEELHSHKCQHQQWHHNGRQQDGVGNAVAANLRSRASTNAISIIICDAQLIACCGVTVDSKDLDRKFKRNGIVKETIGIVIVFDIQGYKHGGSTNIETCSVESKFHCCIFSSPQLPW